jgi:hypothetical protein
MVTDWLGDGTHGIAAKLAALDYDGSDTAVSGTLTIGDETRNAKAAIGSYPSETFGCLVQLNPAEQFIGQSSTHTHDYDVPILVRFIRESSDAAAATRDLLYTLRATMQTVDALFDESIAAAVTARTRNQVQAHALLSISGALTREQREDNKVTAAISLTIRARDLLA